MRGNAAKFIKYKKQNKTKKPPNIANGGGKVGIAG